jgi:hypothetical protein
MLVFKLRILYCKQFLDKRYGIHNIIVICQVGLCVWQSIFHFYLSSPRHLSIPESTIFIFCSCIFPYLITPLKTLCENNKSYSPCWQKQGSPISVDIYNFGSSSLSKDDMDIWWHLFTILIDLQENVLKEQCKLLV